MKKFAVVEVPKEHEWVPISTLPAGTVVVTKDFNGPYLIVSLRNIEAYLVNMPIFYVPVIGLNSGLAKVGLFYHNAQVRVIENYEMENETK